MLSISMALGKSKTDMILAIRKRLATEDLYNIQREI
jgi:hypothetical protein